MNNKFSENLKKIRKEKNLSQEQLAEELGVSRQAISKWESSVAYPEMDKIIALCDKFNLNIDDLLHKDINEKKKEEENKKKINSMIDDFLKYITNSINLFVSINFKSKLKCIFEQLVILFILFLISMFIYSISKELFDALLRFLPDNIYYFITDTIRAVLSVALAVMSVIVLTHIFKIRYLDYFDNKEVIEIEKKEKDNDTSKDNKLSIKKKNIIIRDPENREYKFINSLLKIMVPVIKFFLICLSLFIVFTIVSLLVLAISSFLIYKTGPFFIGILISLLSVITIQVLILLVILNFIFNRKNNNKKTIIGIIISILILGIGCGLIFVGTLSFNVPKDNSKYLKTITKEYEMKEDLIIHPYYAADIEYIESDNNNIKIEYSVNKYFRLDDHYNNGEEPSITYWPYCDDPITLAKAYIKDINNKELVPLNLDIESIKVYTNSTNIDKLKRNWSKHQEEEPSDYSYETKIDELERQKGPLEEKIEDE